MESSLQKLVNPGLSQTKNFNLIGDGAYKISFNPQIKIHELFDPSIIAAGAIVSKLSAVELFEIMFLNTIYRYNFALKIKVNYRHSQGGSDLL